MTNPKHVLEQVYAELAEYAEFLLDQRDSQESYDLVMEFANHIYEEQFNLAIDAARFMDDVCRDECLSIVDPVEI